MNANEPHTHEAIDEFTFCMNQLLEGKTHFRLGLLTVERIDPVDDLDPSVHIRLVASAVDREQDYLDHLRNLAYHLAADYLSETTNNDACNVLVREISAHFPDELSYLEDHPLGAFIAVDATVEDYLS